jgi:hypothetical protein
MHWHKADSPRVAPIVECVIGFGRFVRILNNNENDGEG